MRTSPVGKRVGDDFYIHVSALDLVPPVLRLAEFAARRLVGQVDVEDLTRFADAHVDPCSIASQHSGDVQGQRRAIAQEPTNPVGPALELIGRGHHDQFESGPAGVRLSLEIAPRDGDERVGSLGCQISRGRFGRGRAGSGGISRGRIGEVQRGSQDQRVFGANLRDEPDHAAGGLGETGESALLVAAFAGIRVGSDPPQSGDDFVELAGRRAFGHVEQRLPARRRA